MPMKGSIRGTINQTQSEIRGNRKYHILSISLILITSIAIYSNILKNGFVFDDIPSIVENYKIRDLSNFYDLSGNRYIGFLSFALNHHFGKLDVFGYHIVNIIIHIINGLLVYYIIHLTFKTPVMKPAILNSQSSLVSRPSSFVIPLTAALIFISHPIQTQAVTYIVQRFTSLATLFYLLSVVLYIKARLKIQDARDKMQETKGEKNLASYFLLLASCISAILAMKTKEISFTLPFIVLLYEFMFFSTFSPRPSSLVPRFSSFLFLIPLLLTILIIPLSLIGADKPIGDIIGEIRDAAQETEEIPRSVYLFTQLRVIVTYIRLLFIPINQNLDYDYPLSYSLFEPYTFISFLFLLSILISAVYLFLRLLRTGKFPSPLAGEGRGEGKCFSLLISFGIFWFFITLSVESSIIPIRDVINEHRLYLPSVGFMIIVSAGLFYLFSIFSLLPSEERVRPALSEVEGVRGGLYNPVIFFIGLVFLIVTASSIATYERNKVWRGGVTLWSDVVNKSPEKARPYINLGVVYKDEGLFDKAIEQYQIALKLNPRFSEPYHNLGNVYKKKGLLDKAIEQYQIALRLNPDFPEAHYNLANVYKDKGLLDKAIEQYQIALRLNPDFPEAHYNLGIAYITNGLFEKAIECFQSTLRFRPDFPEAYNNLGRAYYGTGVIDKAIEQYQIALRLNPDFSEAHNNLGNAYAIRGLTDMAIEQYQIALKLKPNIAEAHNNLGNAYAIRGLTDMAIEQYQIALKLKPDFQDAQYNLKKILETEK